MDFGSTSPLFQVPSFTSLMGPVSPAFWDASFGQQTELFPQELKGISPNSVWSSNNHILSAYEPPVFDLTRNQLDFEPKLSPHRSPPSPLNQSPKGNSVLFRDSNPALDPKPTGGASAHLAKKSDWVHSVVTDTPAFYHVLSPSGHVLFASDSIQDLAGYGPRELKGRSITDKLHPDDIEPFVNTFNQCIATRTPLSIYARLRKANGRYLVIEFTGHARYGDTEPGASALSALTGIDTASSTIAKCIFAVGRLYPSKHTAPLDALLEHKIEHEMLQAQAQGLYNDLGIDSLSATGNGIYSQGIDIAGALRSQDTNVPGTFGTYSAPPYATAQPLSTSKVASGDDKKKHKNRRGNDEHDYVCHECGTADSPEWRKGPNGPKTLCNACGLRFAKKSRMAGKR